MKLFPVLGLILLAGACTEAENEVKDLRGNKPSIEQNENADDSSTSDNMTDETSAESTIQESASSEKVSEWSYKVISISENNWGYQLFQKGKMIINQTSIPSVQGIDGFDTQEKAERTASHILQKLENGVFPPTVNKEELDSLDVLRD